MAPRLSPQHKYFAANLAVLWLAVLFYRTNHFYLGFLSSRTEGVLLWLALSYTLGGLVWYRLRGAGEPSHAYVAFVALGRWFKDARRYLSEFPESNQRGMPGISKSERTSLLFLLLKIFYVPMMLEFLLGNWKALADRWWSYGGVPSLPPLQVFNDFIFPCLIDLFFITECALYTFGYLIESSRFKNVVRSVEPTVIGWAVTLACYPPFNGLVNNYVLWYTSENPTFSNAWVTCVARVAALACFALYVWGAVSLGTKCSNLTNRGIVSSGAFAWVRHPAYVAKNLGWWIALLPAFSLPAVLSMTFWTGLYFLRAITEERHLGADPDYAQYCKRVRYRFVPGVY